MSTEHIGQTRSVEAAADLSLKQHYIIKLDSTGKAAIADSNSAAIAGVLQNTPTSGQEAAYAFTGTARVILGGTVGVNAWVTSDGSGKAIATVTNQDVILGRYVGTAAGASGDLGEIQLGIGTLSHS